MDLRKKQPSQARPEPRIRDENTRYGIYPAIGIARLGNSPDQIYLGPEQMGGLPIQCLPDGSVPDGKEAPTHDFRDAAGLIKRQAARFRVLVYDQAHPGGREIRRGDTVVGQGTSGQLIDIEWTVWLANKKASWYQFQEQAGEHGYAPGHPLRNADVTDPGDRQNLIIDPGPQTVSMTGPQRAASFKKGENPAYSQNFPPPLQPNSIDTLGDVNCIQESQHFRLIVRGGHGNSGSYKTGPQHPRIGSFANNDGWFDDTSDGPVTARLLYVDQLDHQIRYQEVQDPAWVIVGSPSFAPQIVGMVTMNDVLYDLNIREFAFDTYLYGRPGTFQSPERIDTADKLEIWRDNDDKVYNPGYYPYFWRDIWPILIRPYNMQWVTAVLGTSNAAHDTSDRGDFAKNKISLPPAIAMGSDGPSTSDPFAFMRHFIYDMLRRPGEENMLFNKRANWDYSGLSPEDAQSYKELMPLLCGDNPISNTLVSKFLRLTDTQLFLLKQWADGKFINERNEGFVSGTAISGAIPSSPSLETPDTGLRLTAGVLNNVVGGALCPGGEVGWIMRSPAIWASPYRLRINPLFVPNLTARSVSDTPGLTKEFLPPALSLDGDLSGGLEPGDLTKYMALPWQADFNECSTQIIDVTYEQWNVPYDQPENGQTLETLWWPWHRPMQVYYQLVFQEGTDTTYQYQQMDWARGIPQTPAGDLKMVTAWSELGFLVNNYNDPDSGFSYVVIIDASDPANKDFLKPDFQKLSHDLPEKPEKAAAGGSLTKKKEKATSKG
jgi:hypothetical protein